MDSFPKCWPQVSESEHGWAETSVTNWRQIDRTEKYIAKWPTTKRLENIYQLIKKVRKKQKIGRYPMGLTIRSRSSRDECSTDIQSYTLDKQIIWINGSLSAQLERLFTDSAFSFLPQNSHLPTTLMMLSTWIVPRQLSIYSPNPNPCCLLLKKSIWKDHLSNQQLYVLNEK